MVKVQRGARYLELIVFRFSLEVMEIGSLGFGLWSYNNFDSFRDFTLSVGFTSGMVQLKNFHVVTEMS